MPSSAVLFFVYFFNGAALVTAVGLAMAFVSWREKRAGLRAALATMLLCLTPIAYILACMAAEVQLGLSFSGIALIAMLVGGVLLLVAGPVVALCLFMRRTH